MRFKSFNVRWILFGIAVLFALPISWKGFSGFYLWTSPYLMLLMVIGQFTFGGLQVIAILVLIASFMRHRWYCKWMCPTGALCDAVSKRGRRSGIVKHIPALGIALAVAGLVAALTGTTILGLLDPISIFYTFFSAFKSQPVFLIILKAAGLVLLLLLNFVLPFVWCGKVCPLGGLQDLLTRLKRLVFRSQQSRFNHSRRLALGAITGFAAGFSIRSVFSNTRRTVIRPPAALPEAELLASCLRCGNCGKACPTDIIQSSFDLSDLAGILTPHVSLKNGYCLPECTACGDVCPSGTLKRITGDEKKNYVMGIAVIHVKDCLLTQLKECNQCKNFCSYQAVVIKKSNTDFSASPEIIKDACVGCGACVIACPVSVIEVLPNT